MDNFSSRLLRSAGFLALALPLAARAQTVPTLVDVKNSSSVSRFSIHTNGALLAGGEYDGGQYYENASPIPAEGSGTRLMWYPGKAAFRAGYINGTQWDDANIGLYSNALGYGVRASGDYGTAMGFRSTAAQQGGTAIGMYCTASGAASVALGYYAHTNARQGTFVFSDRSVTDDNDDTFTDESFRAEYNHTATWRVINGFRIYTMADKSKGVIIQSGNTLVGTGSNPSWYQSGSVISTHTGAYLSSGGTWTNASDRNKKHRFAPVSGEDVLRRLRQVPLTSWSYKTDPATVRHLGPMAQDFRRAFGLGQDSISIGTVDADGVALAAAQALDARTRQQAAQLTMLQTENRLLRTRLDALEQRSNPLSAGLPLAALLLVAGAGVGGLVLRRR
ncbi:tail fiber domain-containing protein [Hymenobacter lucidus]|uniref:Tail fiber domain-containing protein n=1 Tax=Hymenobacter lucidus TaxID=2880930 RepID=A0ABS8ARD3_9BACT|nr:tail fiber domain-containing protein [Hymenobacter lucidus]MCB2408787.1 tail fiber domain-containing protein [Hymenobacter lucidus]